MTTTTTTTTTNTLEINTLINNHDQYLLSSPIKHIHLQQKKQHTIDSSGYHSDDLSFASSPTTSTSSRRSSFSSFSSSSIHSPRNQQCKSLPPSTKTFILYPTLKSAHDRIEWLEEQMRTRQQSNEIIVKEWSFQIDTFLKNRPGNNLEPTSSSLHSNTEEGTLGPTIAIVDKLNELKDLVHEYNIILKKPDVPGIGQDKEEKIFFSTQIIENWIHSATKHKEQKQDLQNVDHHHTRLVQAIQQLSKNHTMVKKQLRHAMRSKKSHTKKIERLQLDLNHQLEEKIEIEQLLDEVRKEMENMMEELNQVKLQRERYFEKCKRYQDDLKAIKNPNSNSSSRREGDNDDEDILALQALLRESETQIDQLEADYQEQCAKMKVISSKHAHQVSALVSEKEELRRRLVTGERSAAELSLMMAVQKKQGERQQASSEMEQVLRRTVAERDGELAKVKFELEKSQRHWEQMKTQQDKQMQRELNTRLSELESEFKNQYKKESDTYQLRISRDIRNMTSQMVDLEAELQDLERQHEQLIAKANTTEQRLKKLQASYEITELEAKQSIAQLEQKIELLEREALVLYCKNLELTQHLGELED